MSKLIYSPTSTVLEGTYNGIKDSDQSVNSVFYSIAFTGDGYMYTHGKKFRLFNVINDAVNGLAFQIQNGTAQLYIDNTSVGSGTVVQSVTGDGIVTATTSNGAVTLGHAATLTAQQVGTFGSTSQIPIITVNETGHITSISNSNSIDVSKLKANATTTTGTYYPIGVTGNTLQNPTYHTSLHFDESGNLYANNLYIGNDSLSSLFAAITHVTVYATDVTYGHVILSDSVDADNDTSTHIAATPKAVSAGVTAANNYAEQLFAAQDAMVFVGTIKSTGIITSHNTTVAPTVINNTTNISNLNYKVGWTFRFVEAGTFNGEDVEVGDMLIAVKNKNNNFNIEDWTVIQTNISGALTATSNLNGLLYANNSRVVNALALSSGILKYDGTNLAFVHPNTTWRDIQVDSISIGTNILNIIPGNAISISRTDGQVTIGVTASSVIQASAALTLEQGQISFQYKPTAAATLTIGNLLTLEKDASDNYTLKHSTVSNSYTNKLGSITTDNYGHVTGLTEVTSLKNPHSLIIKANSSSAVEYDGSTTKTLIFKDNGDLSFTLDTDVNNNPIILPTVTHKYRGVQFYTSSSAQSATALLANNVNTVLTLIGGTNVTLSNLDSLGQDLPDGTLMINAEDTWRNIEAYRFANNLLSRSSIGTSQLNFSNDFILYDNELSITWTEIDSNGSITYVR